MQEIKETDLPVDPDKSNETALNQRQVTSSNQHPRKPKDINGYLKTAKTLCERLTKSQERQTIS